MWRRRKGDIHRLAASMVTARPRSWHRLGKYLALLCVCGAVAAHGLAGQVPSRQGGDSRRASEVIARIRGLFQKHEAERKPFDLSDAIRDVLALLESQLTRNSVTISLDLAANLPPSGPRPRQATSPR
jgi:hypothetical protein